MFNRRDVVIEYPGKLPCQRSRYWKRPWRTSGPCRAGWRTPWRGRSRTHRGREGRPGQGCQCNGGGGRHPREEAGGEYAPVEGVEKPVAYPFALAPLPYLCLTALRRKKIHRSGHISLLLLEKAMDFCLGVHNHKLGDLAEERNRAYVSQGRGAPQLQEAGRRRHQKRTPQPMRRESLRRGKLL